MKRLKDYAKENGIQYRAAWNRYKAGKILGAFQDEMGNILINENLNRPQYIICYCRVSSSKNKNNLDKQADRLAAYCAAKGYKINQIVKECASGLNDKRPKLIKVLKHPEVTHIVVEHHDRLTRFGFNYLENWMQEKDCEIEVINPATHDKDDLMKDFVSLVTRFTARLYGLRLSKRKTEQLIETLNHENTTLK